MNTQIDNKQSQSNEIYNVLPTVNFLQVGKIVFFTKTEQFWDKPFTMKRHHVYDTRSMILRGEITAVKGNEFKAKLIDNNFSKDGQEFVFNKGTLLCNQDFKDFAVLGKWRKN